MNEFRRPYTPAITEEDVEPTRSECIESWMGRAEDDEEFKDLLADIIVNNLTNNDFFRITQGIVDLDAEKIGQTIIRSLEQTITTYMYEDEMERQGWIL
jgi:hypothetical protein